MSVGTKTRRPVSRVNSPVRTTTAGSVAAPAVVTPEWPVVDTVVTLPGLTLEGGETLDEIRVHYRLEGRVAAARDNVVLVVHALTGTAEASAWWKGVIGAGHSIDPTRHAVLSAALLGGCDGTTGPSDAEPDALPPITTRDQARVLALLLDHLHIPAPLLVCGGSLGGMVTLEFAASFPERTRGAVVLAAPAVQTAQGIAWNAIMKRAIALGGAREGFALARMVGMLSYRTPQALEQRFGRRRTAAGHFDVADWLDAHGERLVARFDATSYGALLEAMDSHDVGRGRGGVSAALAPVADRLTAVGIPGDLLYPDDAVREWADAAHATYRELPSVHGHDAFLLETTKVSRILAEALDAASRTPLSAPATRAINASRNASRNESHNAYRDAARPRLRRVALAGCGFVGGSLLELLTARHRDLPGQVVVPRVLVRDAERERPALQQAIRSGLAPANACITDPLALLDDDIDVLVEAIGGTDVAAELVEAALARGIHVVTANKALLGLRGETLRASAEWQRSNLSFEGAVCGAIPIVRCLQSGAAGVDITGITGILNGTSNFVLQQLAEGHSLSEAVQTAQRLGYAEADPTRDLNGQDAEDKLRILAWLAFGVAPHALEVRRRGLDEETAQWARDVAASGDRVKLLAEVQRVGEQLIARIEPRRVAADDAWARVDGPFNRIVVESRSAGSLVFQGPGAGGLATAGAVLSDLLPLLS